MKSEEVKKFLGMNPRNFFGGEGGIRTRETLLTPTRFPVVRLRPAQPPLHTPVSLETSLFIILHGSRFVKHFLGIFLFFIPIPML